MIFLVLIDNCIVLFVSVCTLFILNGELTLIALNNETKTTFVNL